jgi:hypothetical protein
MKYILSLLVCIGCIFSLNLAFADCTFNPAGAGGQDIINSFKDCAPQTGIKAKNQVDLKVTKSGSDFRDFTAVLVRRVQIITSIIAIGIIVWIGLIMVLPVSAEAKESAKSKFLSVLLGFLFMISATIVVNALINLLYEILK